MSGKRSGKTSRRRSGRNRSVTGGIAANNTSLSPAGDTPAPPYRQSNAFEGELSSLKQIISDLQDKSAEIHARIDGLRTAHPAALGHAVVDPASCRGCGMCEQVCPVGAINVVRIAEVDEHKCTGCGACVAACPVGALALK